MRRRIWHVLAVALLGAGISAAAACGGETCDEECLKGDDSKGAGGKADAWDWRNDPERFRVEFNYKLAELPREGKAESIPWPASYWPTYQDSTNHRWQGRNILSPLEKYDAAFNDWTADATFMSHSPMNPDACESYDATYYELLGPAAKWQHEHKGLGRLHDGRDNDGDGQTDECDGEDYDGIETWWGLCHAWAPAAILEPEPLKPVTFNGITFEVSDIKALLITLYDNTYAYMLGGRCNAKEVERDENGRLKADECRDTNAGAFHVVVTNMLGVYKRSFVEDRVGDYEVWNQPVYSYRVTELKEVTLKEALELLGLDPSLEKYPYNEDATAFYEVRMELKYVTESWASTEPFTPVIDRYLRTDNYHYLLEVDENGKIVGGEWLGSSKQQHPDFLWLPTRRSPWGVNPHVSYEKVKMLLEMARKTDEEVEGEIHSYEQTEPVDIPDNDPAGVVSVIEVPDDIPVGSLTVKVNIEHTYIGDLVVELRHGDKSVRLHNRQGGGADNLERSFELFAEFSGVSAKGEWELWVSDNAGVDVGRIVSWSLVVNTTAVDASLKTYESSPNLDIPDNDETGVSDTIRVPDSGVVRKLRVTLNIEHGYVGDLVVELKHNGTTRKLHNRSGGSADDLKASYAVEEFIGAPMEGDWTLTVKDVDKLVTGTLVSWKLEILPE